MKNIAVGLALRDRLGESATRQLTEFVDRHSSEARSDVMEMCNTQVAGLSTEIATLSDRISDLKIDLNGRLAELRVELLRWTFLFWVGQFAAVMTAMFAALALFAQWFRS
jgi:hypothetical protein